jgi:NDP-sugar pyrophosphorylase family protein
LKSVILAGGLGERLRPFTNVLPKPLIPISGEKTVLEIQIANLAEHGFREITIATNYKSQLIESYLGDGSQFDVKLSFSREENRLGTCGPLTLIKDKLTEPFLLMNGDILTEADLGMFYQFGIENDSLLTVATKEIIRPFDFGNVLVEDNHITAITEKPDMKFLIVAGIYVLKPAIFEYIPDHTYFGIDQLIRNLIQAQLPVASYQISEYWVDIGRIEDINAVVEDYEAREQTNHDG